MIAPVRGIVAALTVGVGLLAAGAVAPAPASAAPTVTTYTGSLSDGASWKAEVPATWNGTLLLFNHGYLPSFAPIPNVAQDAPDPTTAAALLAEGYALTGSSYAAAGWALNTAVADQLNTLTAATAAIGRRPARVLTFGMSMGGLVTALLAERASDRIAGAMSACGIVGGAAALQNYQLDGERALATLLAPAAPVKLVRFTTVAEAFATTTTLVSALQAAQTSAAGRARIALAAALYQAPSWRPGQQPPTDAAGIEQGQYEWLNESLSFTTPGRFDIEAAEGGNSAWDAGVDYRKLLGRAADLNTVRALYRAAGLNLDADLATLTAAATTTADPAALVHTFATSVPFGTLRMPMLTLHTTADQLVPLQHENAYRDAVTRAGRSQLLRQAFVARPGHCAFTAAELVAGVHALDHRVSTGRWDDVATTVALQHAATGLDLGAAAFVDASPAHLLRESFGGDDTLPITLS